MHSASFATGENVLQWEQLAFSKKMAKCALWGLRGRTPYKVIKCLLCILAKYLDGAVRSHCASGVAPPYVPPVINRVGTKDYSSNV